MFIPALVRGAHAVVAKSHTSPAVRRSERQRIVVMKMSQYHECLNNVLHYDTFVSRV